MRHDLKHFYWTKIDVCFNLSPRQQIKGMEDKYHEAEEERINVQVAMEMELEKKQNNLEHAQRELEKIQKDIVKVLPKS